MPDARRQLAAKLDEAAQQRRLEARTLAHLAKGMAIWSLLVLPPTLCIDAAYALALGFAVLFAPGPLFAWYSWRLAWAELARSGPAVA